jgi:predicted ribosomally synthesized peptide with nif11-like leader
MENLKQYGKMCAEDEKVRAKAKKIGLQDIDGQIAYAKSLGLEFSREDMEALSKEAGLGEKDELSEEDLKKVAGGVWTLTLLAVGAAAAGYIAAMTTMPGW